MESVFIQFKTASGTIKLPGLKNDSETQFIDINEIARFHARGENKTRIITKHNHEIIIEHSVEAFALVISEYSEVVTIGAVNEILSSSLDDLMENSEELTELIENQNTEPPGPGDNNTEQI